LTEFVNGVTGQFKRELVRSLETKDARLATGHTGGRSIGRTYGRGFSKAPLGAAIKQMVPPVDLSRLEWPQFR
jgi:hypothetical protein